MGWAARGFARMVFPTLARAGWSYSKMLKYAKGKGWTYAPKVMASDIREMRSSAQFSRKVMDLGFDVGIPKTIMTEVELTMKRKYKVIGLTKMRNIETGNLKYVYKSQYRNVLLSKEEYARDYIARQNIKRGTGDWLAEGFDVVELQHYRGYPY